MKSITTEYHEKIVIPPEDVIPKSRAFQLLKYSLLVSIVILILTAIFSAIIAESFVKPNKKDALTIGIVAVVGVCLFLMGVVAILKEHITLILVFAFTLIVYLLIFMYARIFTAPGWILLRTLVIMTLALGAFAFAIMIREWRYLQMSKLNHTAMKQYAQQYQDSIYSVHYEVPNNLHGYQDVPLDAYQQQQQYPLQQQQQQFQPQVFINGIPNARQQQQQQRLQQHPGQRQVQFAGGIQTSPVLESRFQQHQQNASQQLSGQFVSQQQQQQRQHQPVRQAPLSRQQQQQQHSSRTLPPYVDVYENMDNYSGGNVYYK